MYLYSRTSELILLASLSHLSEVLRNARNLRLGSGRLKSPLFSYSSLRHAFCGGQSIAVRRTRSFVFPQYVRIRSDPNVTGLLEDVPTRLVPIGELEITSGGFEEEVRDGDEDSDQELESLASQVAERTLEEEDEDNQQVVGLSRY